MIAQSQAEIHYNCNTNWTHMAVKDREKADIEGQRQRDMAEVLRLQRLERWPALGVSTVVVDNAEKLSWHGGLQYGNQ